MKDQIKIIEEKLHVLLTTIRRNGNNFDWADTCAKNPTNMLMYILPYPSGVTAPFVRNVFGIVTRGLVEHSAYTAAVPERNLRTVV